MEILTRQAGAKWLALVAVTLVCGCASTGPIAPLVPLPDYMMPSQDELAFRPWRVVISPSGGRYRQLEQTFCAALKQQLTKYGILNVSSDARTSQILQTMLQAQVESGANVSVSDVTYEQANADGVLSVSVTSMTVPKRNAVTTWYDKKKKVNRHIYTSQVDVVGYCTLVKPETGMAQTIPFRHSETQTSYDKPHQFSADQMAQTAVRQAAQGSGVVRPLYTEFPLVGHVIGVGETDREILVNRGANQGVRRGREWELLMRSHQQNALMGDMVTDQVVGEGRTVRVYADSCVVKCTSRKTRERAKLGMRVRAKGFGFSLAALFGLE